MISTAKQIIAMMGRKRCWKPSPTYEATLCRVRELSEQATLRPSPFVLELSGPDDTERVEEPQ
jgi:hypothetical protein